MTDRDDEPPTPPAQAPDTAQEATGNDPTATVSDDLRPGQREAQARRIGRRAPIIGGGFAIVAAALMGIILTARANVLFEFDEEWAEDLLGLRGPVGDVFAYFMNTLGGGVVGVFVVPILAALAMVILRRPWGALYFIVASAASAGAVQLLKNLFGRARPEEIIVASDFGSFPSGHVANAATIAVAVGVIMPHVWVWIAGAVYTVLMAISRTYLGAHWLSDTIGGVLVGAGVALLVWAVFAAPLERERLAWIARVSARNAARAQANVTPPAKRRA